MEWLVAGAATLAAVIAMFALFYGATLRLIAAWQVVGGILIIVAGGAALLRQPGSRVDLVNLLTGLAIAGLALRAGVLLWRNDPAGLALSLLTQSLQTAWVSLPFARFGSTLGPLLGVQLDETSLGFELGFYGRAGVHLPDAGTHFPLGISINVLAISALLVLVRARRSRLEPAAA